MPILLAILTTIIMGFVAVQYSYLIIKKKNQPVLTTWLLFSLVTSLSFITYLFHKNHSFSGNIVNLMDVIMCFSIFLTLLFVKEGVMAKFTKLEKLCLALTVIILVIWFLTKNELLANFLLQGIITIAYFPTFARLYNSKYNYESVGMWIAIFLATISGLIASYSKKDLIGVTYAFRGLILISILFILIARLSRLKEN